MDHETEQSRVTKIKQIQYIKVISSVNTGLKHVKTLSEEDNLIQSCYKKIQYIMAEHSITKFFKIQKQYLQQSQAHLSFGQDSTDDPERYSYIQKLKDTPIERNNIFKNITQSFLKFVTSKQYKSQLISLYSNNNSNSNSKLDGLENSIKVIKRKLKKQKCQWNQKIVSLLKSSKHQKIFKYYLEDIENLWLKYSKVENKENTIWYTKLLLRAIEDPILREEIKYYKRN